MEGISDINPVGVNEQIMGKLVERLANNPDFNKTTLDLIRKLILDGHFQNADLVKQAIRATGEANREAC